MSQCQIISLSERKATSFLDGRKIGQVKSATNLVDEDLLKAHQPLLVTLGHYFFDNTPMIGKIIDVNMWSRHLTDAEAMRYSECIQYIKGTGDLINSTTEFSITGSNEKRIKLDSKEVLCNHESSTNQLFLHTTFTAQIDAKEACDKYLMNSMAGPFKDVDGDWKIFHEKGSANKAVRKFCWMGGRILVWQSYKHLKKIGEKNYNFVHIGTDEDLQIHPWQPSQPNGNLNNDLCILDYFGLLFNSSWWVFDCVQPWNWAGCAGCWLPNTFSKGIVINMRGLCDRTLFDSVYQVGI